MIILDILTLPFVCFTETVMCTPFTIRTFFTLTAMIIIDLTSVTNPTCYNQGYSISFISQHAFWFMHWVWGKEPFHVIDQRKIMYYAQEATCLCSLTDIVIIKSVLVLFNFDSIPWIMQGLSYYNIIMFFFYFVVEWLITFILI